jgi:outer membrane biosynthesis protein TonB
MSLLKPLQKATGCKPKADEDRQDYLVRLTTAVSEMQEDDWAKLPDDSQDWINDAITALKAKKEVSDPDEAAEAEPEAKPAKKPKPAAVEEEAEEPAAETADEDEPKPAKKAKPAKVEAEEEDEVEPAKPAKKAAKAPGGAGADKFRQAYAKAYVVGKQPKPEELCAKLGNPIPESRAHGLAYEVRKVVDAMQKAGLVKED